MPSRVSMVKKVEKSAILTYRVCGLDRETASSTRPIVVAELPQGPLMAVQVSPESKERNTPLPITPAYWLAKLLGSTSRSVAVPARRNDQVEPPSVDL